MKTHEYQNGDLTIIWTPELCKHAGVCVKMLPNVYHPKEKPWVHPLNATKDELITQIKNCPTGALSYKIENNERKS